VLGTRYAGIVLSRRHDDIGAAMILEEYRGCLIDIGRIVERTVTYRMKVRNSDGDGEVIRLRNTAECVYGSVALKDQCEARDSMRFTGSCLQSGDRSEMWPCLYDDACIASRHRICRLDIILGGCHNP